jgi:hypothetical protein
MKKILSFLSGFIIIMIVIATVNISLRLFNYISFQKINTVLMQPSELWQNRIETPVALSDMSDDYIKSQLITKFVTEYLKVIPVPGEISARTNQTLQFMATPNVLKKWEYSVKPGLIRMASEKQMRRVYIDANKISIRGDYYVVPFTTQTWVQTNNLNILPVTDSGQEMYLKVNFNKKVRDKMFGRDPSFALDHGIPAFSIFEFVVTEALIQ